MKPVYQLMLIAILLLACHSQKRTLQNSTAEIFDEFYTKFHSDSLFQMQRIIFPLEGGKFDYDTEESWAPENWRMKKVTVYQIDLKEYSIVFEKNDTLAFERIYIPNSGFDFQCRYRLINGKWYLVYCLDQNL